MSDQTRTDTDLVCPICGEAVAATDQQESACPNAHTAARQPITRAAFDLFAQDVAAALARSFGW